MVAERRPVPDSFVALMYHNIIADGESFADLSPSATSYFVSRSRFAAQLAEPASCGGYCMTWDQLNDFYGNASDRAGAGGGHSVLLTFDDGWQGTVQYGGPLLEQHSAQALVFITTDFLGRRHFLSRSDVSRLTPKRFRVGSHARTHRMLSLLPEPQIRAELSDSKKLLEDLTGYEVDALSIPSGAVDRRVRRIAVECGYRFVFDSEVRVNRRGDSPTSIGRVALMHDTPPQAFRRYVQQRVAPERVRRAVLSAPKRLLGLRRYERLRRTLLGEHRGQQVTHES
jgi:peptidoglycan/xylan/chitin deacetylase (PgdA/CDA1 family)